MQPSGTGLSPCVWSRGRACGLVEAGRVMAASLTGPGGVCMGPSRRREHWVQGDGRLPSPPLLVHTPFQPLPSSGCCLLGLCPRPLPPLPHRHLPGPLEAGVGVSSPLGRHPLPAVAGWRLRNGAGEPRPPCPPPPGAPHTWKPPGSCQAGEVPREHVPEPEESSWGSPEEQGGGGEKGEEATGGGGGRAQGAEQQARRGGLLPVFRLFSQAGRGLPSQSLPLSEGSPFSAAEVPPSSLPLLLCSRGAGGGGSCRAATLQGSL